MCPDLRTVAGDDAAAACFVPVAEAIARVQWDATKRVIQQAWERFGRGLNDPTMALNRAPRSGHPGHAQADPIKR
jgi:hypothetical protein